MRKICNPGEWLPEWAGEHGDLVVGGMLSFQIGAAICRQNKWQVFTKRFSNIYYVDFSSTVIIDRYSITTRITKYACGKLMHVFIEFLFASQASSYKFVFPSKKRSPQRSSGLFLSVLARVFSWHPVRCSVGKNRPLISFPSKVFRPMTNLWAICPSIRVNAVIMK